MNLVEIVEVDERDSNWEDEGPRFRVYFQRTRDTYIGGWTATYDITGADVLQVLDWAQRQAGDELVYSVALVSDSPPVPSRPEAARGLVWLVGADGNRTELEPAEAEIQRRMLARRRHPVALPEDDRMPAGVLQPFTD